MKENYKIKLIYLKNNTKHRFTEITYANNYNENYNYGFIPKENGIFIIDCDIKGGHGNGNEQFKELCKKHSYIPNDTLIIETPSGGTHYYYMLTEEAMKLNHATKINLNNRRTNIDILTNFATTAPSKIDDKQYKIINNEKIDILPNKILQEILEYNGRGFQIQREIETTYTDEVNLGLFKELLDIIDISYINEHDDWRTIIWAIKSLEQHTKTDLTDLIHYISNKTNKYNDKNNDNIIESIINSFIENNYGISYKSITYYAKLSNINKYNEIYSKYLVKTNEKPLDLTEKGLANLLYDLSGDKYIYQDDKLYIYHNSEWVNDNKAEIWNFTIGNTLIEHLTNEIINLDKSIKNIEIQNKEQLNKIDKKRAELIKYILKLKTSKFTNDIVRQLKYILKQINKHVEFDTGIEQYYNIHFKNGVYETNTATFRKRTQYDYITYFLDYDYVYYNCIDKSIHDMVYDFFVKLQPVKAQRDFTLGFLSYCLTGNTSKQIFKVNIGYTASNGKSTELNIHNKVFPIYTTKLEKNTFTYGNTKKHKSIMCCLDCPIRLAYIEELDQKKLDCDFLKDWVSGDKMTVERLYGLDESKTIQAKLMTCSNKDFVIESDNGILRRGKTQFYTSKFIDTDKDNYEKNIFKRIDNFESIFDDTDYKNAYFHLLLKYVNNLVIPKEATDNFQIIVDESNSMKTDFLELFTITNEKNDMVSKDELTESLIQYKWNDLLSMLKNNGILYDKDLRNNGKKGFLKGVKKTI